MYQNNNTAVALPKNPLLSAFSHDNFQALTNFNFVFKAKFDTKTFFKII